MKENYFSQDDEQQTITINDVADRAGVSVSTVSRILNAKPDVAASTRKRVLRVIEELGYTPQASAQNLPARRSRTIALLFPVEYAVLTQLELDFFMGAAMQAESQNHLLTLITSAVDEHRLVSLYKGGKVDGVILMQVLMDDWRAHLLRERSYPFVMIGRCADNDGLAFIDLDFERAIHLAFVHLYEQGHRHIGFIARPESMRTRGLGTSVRLLKGYLQTCDQYGVTPAYREPALDADEVAHAARALLDEHPELTAMIVSHGAASVPVIRMVEAAGRQVPDDFSVLAVTTNRVATLVTPPLTTINFPTDKMGQQAAEMLMRTLSDPSRPPEQMLLTPELIIRGSTGRV